MPLNARTIAVSIAVICFFGLSFIGLTCGLSTFICWKRAIVGAVLAYIAVVCAVKVINAILMNAMIANQMNRQKEKNSDDTDEKDS